MTRPTDNLRSDHVVIAQAVDILAAMAVHVRGGGAFPARESAVVLRCLREFVVAVHLHKESTLVMPAIAMHGDDEAARLVGEVLRLHDEVTELVHSLVMFWEPCDELSRDECEGFAETVDAVVARLRRLREIEEQELLRACDARVPADDQLDWSAAFARLERERSAAGDWGRQLAPLAQRWCD